MISVRGIAPVVAWAHLVTSESGHPRRVSLHFCCEKVELTAPHIEEVGLSEDVLPRLLAITGSLEALHFHPKRAPSSGEKPCRNMHITRHSLKSTITNMIHCSSLGTSDVRDGREREGTNNNTKEGTTQKPESARWIDWCKAIFQ